MSRFRGSFVVWAALIAGSACGSAADAPSDARSTESTLDPSPRASESVEVAEEAPAAEPLPPDVLADFTGSNWSKVVAARQKLMARPDAPKILLALLDRTDDVELTETADLIYPGAKQFYGHGYVLAYDLDSIAGRAGWTLEELALESFGFELATFTPPRPKERPTAAIAAAKAWWNARGGRADCKQIVTDAIQSRDPVKVQRGLSWIVHTTAVCPSFDRAHYDKEIHSFVEGAARSSDASLRKTAEQLLEQGPEPGLAKKRPK